MATKLIWFRNNLRLNDNLAWAKACLKSDVLLPVYVLNTDWLKTGYYGLERMGDFRLQFLLESLRDLKGNLMKQSSDLLFKSGRPVDVLLNLCKQHGVKKVYFQKVYAFDEMEEEKELERRLLSIGVDCEGIEDDTLVHKEDLPFPISHLPEPFTKFRKWVETEWGVRNLVEKPKQIPALPSNWENEPIPQLADFSRSKPKIAANFKGGETAAINRIQHYFWETSCLSQYKETRNGLLGLDYSSKLSPWLAFGCVSPRQVYHEVLKFEHQKVKNESTYWLIFELLWRDYFKWLSLKYGARLFQHSGTHGRSLVNTKLNEKLFKKWMNAETGVPFVDANMLEIRNTGFMSNRGRQNVASFLVNDLKQPWIAGASYFEKMLIDYDPASNYGNWAYIAGVGVDPRPDRYFNIEKQASMYDPKGEYVNHWLGLEQSRRLAH